jgi:hypothetical protein
MVLSKEVGLSMLGFVLESMDFRRPELLEGPLARLAALLSTLEDGSLFSDWYPPPRPPEQPLALPQRLPANACTASSFASALPDAEARGAAAADALESRGGSWLAKKAERSAEWTLDLAAAGLAGTAVSSASISFAAKYTPQTVVLLVQPEGGGAFEEVASEVLGSGAEWPLPVTLMLPESRRAARVRVRLSGFSRGNTSQQLSLRGVQLRGPHRSAGSIVPVVSVLASLQRCALEASRCARLRSDALAVLGHLLRSSGSLDHALAFLEALLSPPDGSTPAAAEADEPLGASASEAAVRLMGCLVDRLARRTLSDDFARTSGPCCASSFPPSRRAAA